MIRKQRILITGSNGLLGQELVRKLSALPQVEIIAASRGENRITSVKNFIFERLDITDAQNLKRVFGRHRPETIIHTAAMTNVNQSEKEKEACWKINVEAVQSMVREAEKRGAHLIHLSSDFVFDGTRGPYREEDPVSPVNYYGKSKEAAEKIVRQAKIPWTIVRTILVYGTIENTPEHRNVVSWAVRELSEKRKIKVVNDQFRMPTWADDLAEGCIAAALKRAAGIYHISGKDWVSVLELVRLTAEVFGLDASQIEPTATSNFPEIAPRPPKTGFILDKARRDLNYAPHSLRAGLEEIKKSGALLF